ncbi:MAG: class I SAM-dependent methyltransferase [Chloroflexi bacterium]|nr:class I SAM-dependent methyltransferase [Chloroflexota bacterium]
MTPACPEPSRRDPQPVSDPSGGYDEYDFVAEFYDHVVPTAARRDLDFWVEMARQSGGPVLEVGCGTGRVLIATARAGIEIAGLDLSAKMLSVCRQKLSREPQDVRARVELVEADMRNFDLGRRFRVATTPFRPFQHLVTVQDQIACLESIRRHLADGGRLVLDVFNPRLDRLVDERYFQEGDEEPEFVMPDGRRVIRRHRVVSRDLLNQVQNIELIYYVTHPDGRRERLVHAFPMRYLFRFEVEHLLARCGFEVEDVYGDFDKSPYGSKYPGELIFVARKA